MFQVNYTKPTTLQCYTLPVAYDNLKTYYLVPCLEENAREQRSATRDTLTRAERPKMQVREVAMVGGCVLWFEWKMRLSERGTPAKLQRRKPKNQYNLALRQHELHVGY